MRPKYRTKKRSDRVVMTDESRVLKLLRLEQGLSMRQAAVLLGLSDSYIAHVETGRMDPPDGDKLKRLLDVYGTRVETFRERVRSYQHQLSPKEELFELVKRMRKKEIETVVAVARSLVG